MLERLKELISPKQFGLFIILTLLFYYLLFPFGDLRDKLTNLIIENTGGGLNLDFQDMNIGVLPKPYVEFSNVNVSAALEGLNNLSISTKEINIYPHLTRVLLGKIGVSITAKDIWGGNVDLNLAQTDKVKGPDVPMLKYKMRTEAEFSDVNMALVSKNLELPLNLGGLLNGGLSATIDPNFNEQPGANVDLIIKKAVIPEGPFKANLNGVPLDIPLPQMNLQEVVVKGSQDPKNSQGFQITQLNIGSPSADLSANVTGKIEVKFMKLGTQVTPQLGTYNLAIKLTLSEPVAKKIGSYLFALNNFKQGNTYAFKISGQGSGFPNLSN